MTRIDSKKTMQEVASEVQAKRGKSKGWPANFEYEIEPAGICKLLWKYVESKVSWRRLDSWGVAFLLHCERHTCEKFQALEIHVRNFPENPIPVQSARLEALKRRLSFLNATHDEFRIALIVNGSEYALYSAQELFDRPESEIVRQRYKVRGDDDKGERLEKDFQAFLYGLGFESKEGRCDRLALLGEDFNKANRFEWGVDREFPTGAFAGQIQESTRLLPTEYIDLVSLNKYRQLSVIELKINDTSLRVVSQLLDYALFFAAYRDQLVPIVNERIRYSGEIESKVIVCYVANNLYHQRFDEVAHFYGKNADRHGLKFVKLTLGGPIVLGE